MSGFLLLLILSEVLLPNLTCAYRVRRQTTKVRISAIGDTIILKFLQPDTDTRLEGYILGYGSSLFSKQLIQLPEDGEPYETELDAEPKYLVVVQPVKGEEKKKECTGKESLEKPLHLVIGSVTETSVMLSWGTLLNTLSTETNPDDCIEDGQYTVRYREKEPKKTWNFQTCPTRDTIIDQLKPETPYEFGVRAESRNITGAWSPPVIHNTAARDPDIYTPLKPENILKPKKPITESPPTFSPIVPVSQSKPASLLKHPEPPPTQRATPAKDLVFPKPLKPEKPLGPKINLTNAKPVTEIPQTFSPSVLVLHSVTQSRSASLLSSSEPPPTQRVTQDIHKPRKPEIYLSPEKPITESLQTFSPSLPVVTQSRPTSVLRQPGPPPTQRVMQVLPNVTERRPSLLLRHTAPPPIPRVTLGAGSDGIRTSRPSEDSLFLTQNFTSSYTSMINIGNTNTLETNHSTKSSLLSTTLQSLHSTQTTLITSKTLFNTPKSQTDRIKTVSSTSKAKLNATQKIKTQLHNKIHPQPEASTTTFSTTTQTTHNMDKYPISTDHPKTRSPQPYTIQPTTSITQHNTAKDQLKITQNKFTTLEPITSQSQLDITHPKAIATQSPPHTIRPQFITIQSQSHKTHLKPTASQSPPQTIQPQSITTQSHKTDPKPTASQSPPQTIQPQSITTQSHKTDPKPTASQSPPQTIQPQSITTQSHKTDPTPTASQSPPQTIQPQSITTQSHKTDPKPTTSQSPPLSTKPQTNTVKDYPKTGQPQPITILSQPLSAQTQSIAISAHPRSLLNATQIPNSTLIHYPGTTTQTQAPKTQFQPHPIQPQPDRILPKYKKPHVITTEYTTKSQTKTMRPRLTTTQTKPKKKQQKSRPHQYRTAQPQTTTTQSSTAKSQANVRSHQQHNYIINPKSTHEPNTHHQFSTTLETTTTTTLSTEFQQPDHHPTSATRKLCNTNTCKNGKTEPILRGKPKQPVQTPSEKSNTQNFPRGEKKPVNKKVPVSKMAPSQSLDGHHTKPVLASGATNRNQGQDLSSPLTSVPSTSASTVTKRVSLVSVPNPIRSPPTYSNTSVRNPQARHDEKHKGRLSTKRQKWKKKTDSNETKNQLNQVDKVMEKVISLKVVDALPILKPSTSTPTTEQKPTPPTTPFSAYNGSRYNMGENSSVFSSLPISDLDPMGKKRFVAPHVVYQVDKPPEKPCSVTHALSYFPDEENGVTNITGPPKTPPSNVTVVTVEGCPSFVIIDWEKTDNETTEYEVTSSVKSPNGRVVSVVKTNQTHTAVENLTPESSYEFKVTPKNELGSGPSSDSVSFSTESADPRVSEVPTGKNAIWSSFKFEADTYSECTGVQFVKRTWYRKFVGIQLCNSLRYKIYLSDSLKGKFYNIGDETGYGEDHCQFVDSFLDGRTGGLMPQHHLPLKQGYYRAMRQEPVKFGKIGGSTQINYVAWYECGVPIPGSW
ncbi:target of Nesh-SH3 isoform X1 [Tachysurus fulvidraco]|uniref:target of Nesh-SH3 isoform X1 n=1 Tax=Tachysurus fulvidraco TaxID=1234273 RepID=UPI001FEE0342|nr:target of Nesh-SH3 isoform X1 [Tachysurus fulvidraco]